MIHLDPLAIHAKASIPTLAIASAKDLQSLPTDLEALKSVITSPFESHVIPDMMHVLRKDPDDASARHYARLSKLELDEQVLSITRRWLARQAPTTSLS